MAVSRYASRSLESVPKHLSSRAGMSSGPGAMRALIQAKALSTVCLESRQGSMQASRAVCSFVCRQIVRP